MIQKFCLKRRFLYKGKKVFITVHNNKAEGLIIETEGC